MKKNIIIISTVIGIVALLFTLQSCTDSKGNTALCPKIRNLFRLKYVQLEKSLQRRLLKPPDNSPLMMKPF